MKIFITVIFIVLISACANHSDWGMFITSSMYYPKVEKSAKIVHFGDERFDVTHSGFFKQTHDLFYQKLHGRTIGAPVGKGVITYWKVKTPMRLSAS